MKNKIIAVLVLILLATPWLSAQQINAKAFNLKQAQEYAVQNSYKMQNAAKDINIARFRVSQTTAIGLPQISGSASYQHFINIPTQLMPNFLTPAVEAVLVQHGLLSADSLTGMGSDKFKVQFGSKHAVTAGISASQLIFDGSYIVGLQAAKIYVSLSTNSLKKTEQDVREDVAQAYYLVLVAQENRKVLAATLENLNKNLGEMKEIYKNGFIENTDVDQVQLLVSSLNNTLLTVDQQLELANNMLKYQMGMDINENITLTDPLDVLLNDAIGQNLFTKSFDPEQHISLKLMHIQQDLYKLNLKKDMYAYLPSLAAIYSYQYNAQRNTFDFTHKDKDWFKTSLWGLNLNIPIWSSGNRKYQYKMDRIELEKNTVLMDQVKQGLELEVQNQRSNLRSYTNQYATNKENMDLAQRIYDKNVLKYNEGVGSSSDLTQAHNQLLNAQGTYFNSILQLLNAKSALNKALNNY